MKLPLIILETLEKDSVDNPYKTYDAVSPIFHETESQVRSVIDF